GGERAGRRPAGERARPARPERGPRPPRGRLPPQGPASQTPLFRRPDPAGGGRAAGHRPVHRGGRLDLRQGVAEARDGKILKTGRGFAPRPARGGGGRTPATGRGVFATARGGPPPPAQAASLDEPCAGAPQRRAGVEALLRAPASAPGFLEPPADVPGG